MSDLIAKGMLKAIRDYGLKIPDDISVMGFDNIMFSEFFCPPLTTIKVPKKKMGIKGMNMFLDIFEGKKVNNEHVVLPTDIIERESTTSPKLKKYK